MVQDFQTAWLQSRQEKEQKRIEEIRRAIADGEELERIAYVYEISQNALEEALKEEKVKEGEPLEDKINERKEAQEEAFEINQSENIGDTDMDNIMCCFLVLTLQYLIQHFHTFRSLAVIIRKNL